MSEELKLEAATVLKAVGKGLEIALALVKTHDPLRLPYFSKLLVSAYGACKDGLTPDELVRGFLYQRELLAKTFKELGHEEILAHLMSMPVEANIVALPGCRAAWSRLKAVDMLAPAPAKEETVEPKD